jgi:hypothetical protein
MSGQDDPDAQPISSTAIRSEAEGPLLIPFRTIPLGGINERAGRPRRRPISNPVIPSEVEGPAFYSFEPASNSELWQH